MRTTDRADRPAAPPDVGMAVHYGGLCLKTLTALPADPLEALTPGDRRLPDRAKAVEGLRTGRIRGKDFLDRIVPYTDAPAAYALLRDDPNACFSLVFDWKK